MPVSVVRMLHLGGLVVNSSPPVSPALRCVVILTAVNFGAHLCVMIGFLGRMRKWATNAVGHVARALAFVPMLCVMMLALRLRAMHLGLPDPQPWAQKAMWIATISV